ncbi:MAG: hypothetical protein VX733_14770 [Candidatus Latescibacterota bacterium]|nr:hypothetical protein [Candidatus Latescibacterota bacterium]
MLVNHDFPLRLVASYNPRAGIWRGRRGPGKVAAEGILRFGPRPFTDTSIALEDTASADCQLAAQLCTRAWQLVSRRFSDAERVTELGAQLNDSEHAVRFVHGGDRLVSLDADGAFRVSVDVAPELGLSLEEITDDPTALAPERLRGLELILALAQFHQLAVAAGKSQRAALHWVTDLYAVLDRTDRVLIHGLLEGQLLDSGNLFSLYLRRSSDSEPQERDRHVTWLLGQDRFDLPYDRARAIEILDSDIEVDDKRFLLFDVLRDYDAEVEGDNIRCLTAEVREAGEQLVFGRMSRAFHNQGTLFADSVLVSPLPRWPVLAVEIRKASAGSPALQSQALELEILLTSAEEIPLIQLEGACERFEEAVLDAQRDELLRQLHQARARVEDHGDELASTSLPTVADGVAARSAHDRLLLVERVRAEMMSAPSRQAAYVVISQRPSPTGSHLLVKINEFDEPYLGKSENLRKLLRLAGNRVYSSPDYRWLQHADHWIEAIPLFIKEEVLVDDDGHESTRTVIDIAGMEESFREEMAEHWARNLRSVLESEFLSAARLLLWSAATDEDPLALDAEVRALDWCRQYAEATAVIATGSRVEQVYRRHVGAIQQRVEAEEEPFRALLSILFSPLCDDDRPEPATQGAQLDGNFQEVFRARRPLPVLHVLTTQSAGMTDGYVRTWLEESMSLASVVQAQGLEEAVDERIQHYRQRLRALARQIIHELGIWVEVEEAAATEDIAEEAAVSLVLGRNHAVRVEVAVLGALIELTEEDVGTQSADAVQDPPAVEELLAQPPASLVTRALHRVAERNGATLWEEVERLRKSGGIDEAAALTAVVEGDADYRQDLASFTRFVARREVLERLGEIHAADVEDRIGSYLRRYGRLTQTTARKEVLADRGLNALTLDPLHNLRATGAGKRYHLLYTPSRVDLGHRERESVETWSQWVGGADRAAARVGREIYGLINKSVRSYDSLMEPEVLKTGENASMASHFAFSNSLALMVNATRHGDIEEMGDQMSRRRDRIIHPAGEGYGGYCVPKDGLFLEFVLTLGRHEKLRQLGIPREDHARVANLSARLLDRRPEFTSDFEWEEWAAEYLADETTLREHFELRYRGVARSRIPVFQATRLARVLDNLGQPELRQTDRVTSALVARWGIHHMVAGAEHVNRFMPFFKSWLLRQGVQQARTRHPRAAPGGFVAVLAAEYKPDTQDGRFSVGMRKFEILAGTGDHLFHALDRDGQDIGSLLTEGFSVLEQRGRDRTIAELVGADPDDAFALHHLFPAPESAADLRMVSSTGLSTQDLLGYTSDSRLEKIARQARLDLNCAGFSDAEIDANMGTYGPTLDAWATATDIDADTRRRLANRLGGNIHVLALESRGPERSFEMALQGADVLDAGVPHRELLRLLENPAHIVQLMCENRPDSALVIVDGASGARRRALNRYDVQLWFAAGEAIDRQPIYLSIGVGEETVEAWRAEMRRRRRRCQCLATALTEEGHESALRLYAEIVAEVRGEQEVQRQLAEVDKLRRFGRLRERDEVLSQSLLRVAGGLPLEQLTFEDFLALGGSFLLAGAHPEEIERFRARMAKAILACGGSHWPDDAPVNLLCPAVVATPHEFREEKGIESSNKASEDRPVVALEARRQLAERISRARALNERYRAVEAAASESTSFDEAFTAAKAALGDGNSLVTESQFGAFISHTRNALLTLVRQLYVEEQIDEAQLFIEHLTALFLGRQVDVDNWRAIAGGYEDVGDFGRLAQAAVERAADEGTAQIHLDMVARGAELFYILLAVESTLPFSRAPENTDTQEIWRALADFFAETINDHFYEYRPWVYSRGVGFSSYSGEALYELAVARHDWLHRYLRLVVTQLTEVGELSVEEQDQLLGNFLSGTQVDAIGADADGPAELKWRSYGQLRELAFIRNDGFPLPEVFADFDPEIIAASARVNHIIALPVGRTHYSRALREGPSLNAELLTTGRRGANLIITRQVHLRQAGERRVAEVSSGHLYVSAEEYVTALVRCRGLSEANARSRAEAAHPKGVRLAVRFREPVLASIVYPFHGDPLYTKGEFEDCGLPYSVQSLFHTWTTYDKAKYPDIFERHPGVETPREIDWLAAFTQRAGEERTARSWIENGLPETDYPGLRSFAAQHRVIVVKDAAESGGRNQAAFVLRRPGEEAVDEKELERTVDFVYQISLRHNVAIQEVIVASPEFWATEQFLADFVHRQIVEWGSPVERRRRPHSPLYGSHRVIVSTADPLAPPEHRWQFSHFITLNSKQLITNVGRGGSLEQFLPRFVRPEHRDQLLAGLEQASASVMEALSDYAQLRAEEYQQETGREIGSDLAGVSYGTPRYMMLDFLVTPRFAEAGDLVEVELDGNGQPRFILQHLKRRRQGTVSGWRAVLIEPNIGVGLWDRVTLREEVHERTTADAEGRNFDWQQVGLQARRVLSDLSYAGEQYLQALEASS